jgi:hypothetical protein
MATGSGAPDGLNVRDGEETAKACACAWAAPDMLESRGVSGGGALPLSWIALACAAPGTCATASDCGAAWCSAGVAETTGGADARKLAASAAAGEACAAVAADGAALAAGAAPTLPPERNAALRCAGDSGPAPIPLAVARAAAVAGLTTAGVALRAGADVCCLAAASFRAGMLALAAARGAGRLVAALVRLPAAGGALRS